MHKERLTLWFESRKASVLALEAQISPWLHAGWNTYLPRLKNRILLFRSRPAMYDQFHEWQQRPKTEGKQVRAEDWSRYRNDHQGAISSEDWTRQTLDANRDRYAIADYSRPFCDAIGEWQVKRFKHLRLYNDQAFESDGGRIELFDMVTSDCIVRLSNCFVGEIRGGGRTTLELRDCWVGCLNFEPGSYQRLTIHGGGLLDVRVNGETGFVSGDILIDRVWIPRFQSDSKPNLGGLRKLRTFFAGRNDPLAAGHFHAAELAIERTTESWANRLVGYLYEIGCDYGNSPSRAVCWLAFTLGSIFVFNLLGDVAVVSETQLSGWQMSLPLPSFYSRLLRGFLLAFQSVFNPLGIFGGKSLLVVRDTASMLVVHGLGIIGLLSVAMFFISIRRRFKLD